MNNINYQLDLTQFKLLSNISPDYLPFVLNDIFTIGYNAWVKNFIRNEPNILNSTQTENNITDSKLTSKGQSGENIIIDILKEKFPDYQIENTSKIPHSGDIQVTSTNKIKMIIEVKNYNKTIDQEQIDKLKFDMKFSNINLSIMISLNSGIVGKKRFEIESFYFNKRNNYIIYIPYSMHKLIPTKKYMISHNSLDDSIYNLILKIEYSVCIIQSIGENIISIKTNISNKNIDYLIEQFEKFYDEFRIIKFSCLKLEENIKKNLESHLTIIKDYESNIKSNINNLITKKFNENILKPKIIDDNIFKPKIIIKNINLLSNKYLHQEIFINDILIGKIIKIYDTYDLFVHFKNNITNEFFIEYEECLTFLHSILE